MDAVIPAPAPAATAAVLVNAAVPVFAEYASSVANGAFVRKPKRKFVASQRKFVPSEVVTPVVEL